MFITVCMFVFFFLSVEIAPAERPTPSVPATMWIITSDYKYLNTMYQNKLRE